MPSAELVDSYLHEIAKAYAVEWAPPARDKPGDDDDDDEGGVKVRMLISSAGQALSQMAQHVVV